MMGGLAAVIVMGVSGSGKSTIGKALAEALGWDFRDGDEFHPPENVARMQAGIPLTDADRRPWLAAIAAWIDERRRAGRPAVVACSALKRAYREALADGHGDVRFLHLQGDKTLIAARLAERHGHFMPAALLDSQFAALEEPAASEPVVAVSIAPPPDAVVAEALRRLRAS